MKSPDSHGHIMDLKTISKDGSLATASSSPAASRPTSPSAVDYLDETNDFSSAPAVPGPINDSDIADLQKIFTEKVSLDEPDDQMFRSIVPLLENAFPRDSSPDPQGFIQGVLWPSLRRGYIAEHRDQRPDVEALGVVKEALLRMLPMNAPTCGPSIKVLADASREAFWRRPFGQSGILQFALHILTLNTAPFEVRTQALRIIGNCCGDTDENRDVVVSHGYLQYIIRELSHPALLLVTIPVLYNVLNDYEPAQQQARADDLFNQLIKVLREKAAASTPYFSYLCRIMDFLVVEEMDMSKSDLTTVEVTIATASLPDIELDDRVSLVDAAVAHLKLDIFQAHGIENQQIDAPLNLLLQCCSTRSVLAELASSPSGLFPIEAQNADEEKEIAAMCKSLIQALSDVSAHDAFAARHGSLETTTIATLRGWLSMRSSQLQLCACIMLGNLARSDERCKLMVASRKVHEPLLSILTSANDTSVLHSAAGFLRNLALVPENKLTIGEAGAIRIMARFWTSSATAQLVVATAALTRQLVNNVLDNVAQLLRPLSEDADSPAYSKTYLSLLLSQFEKCDDPAVKVEVARIVAASLRCLHSSTSANLASASVLLNRLFALHGTLGLPLAMMVTQSRWPIIRSEGWFALALVARSPAGSSMAASLLQTAEVFNAVEAAITGETSATSTSTPVQTLAPGSAGGFGGAATSTSGEASSPAAQRRFEPTQEMRSKDRENVMVLLSELLKNPSSQMDKSWADGLKNLLERGAELSD